MKWSISLFILFCTVSACDERPLPLGTATHILTQSDSSKKVEYIKSLLYNPKEIDEYSVHIQQEVLKNCRTNRELWMQYVAGYVHFKNQALVRGIATTWPVEKTISLQIQEYNFKFNFEDSCILPCGTVIAGVCKAKKVDLTTHQVFKWSSARTKEFFETQFRLIHVPTKTILLQKSIDVSGDFKVVCEDNPLRVEIINDTCNICHVVDVASYYDAAKNVDKVSLKDYLNFVRYKNGKHFLIENDFVVI